MWDTQLRPLKSIICRTTVILLARPIAALTHSVRLARPLLLAQLLPLPYGHPPRLTSAGFVHHHRLSHVYLWYPATVYFPRPAS